MDEICFSTFRFSKNINIRSLGFIRSTDSKTIRLRLLNFGHNRKSLCFGDYSVQVHQNLVKLFPSSNHNSSGKEGFINIVVAFIAWGQISINSVFILHADWIGVFKIDIFLDVLFDVLPLWLFHHPHITIFMNILDFQLHQPSLESVFLEFAKEQKIDENKK